MYSELSPDSAPSWSLRAGWRAAVPGRLATAMQGFLQLCHHDRSIASVLGAAALADDEDKAAAPTGRDALRALTGNPAAGVALNMRRLGGVVGGMVSDVVRQGGGGRAAAAGLSSDDLDTMLSKIFVDTAPWEAALQSGKMAALAQRFSVPGAKAAPHGELLSILAVYLALVAGGEPGQRGEAGLRCAAVLWSEFVLELRWHWEHLQPLPRLVPLDGATRAPDGRHCLLQQKVDMLQCCITTQMARNALRSRRVTVDSDGDGFESAVEDDDTSVPPRPAAGTREIHPTLKLLAGGALRVPITQEAGAAIL